MDFLKLWFLGYRKPIKFVEILQGKPAPQWGLYAQILRGLLDSLLLYLPLSLLGRIPPTPPYLTFFQTEDYFTVLIFLTPFVFITQWLLGAAVIHMLLRLHNRPSSIDQILTLTGMASLVIAAFLLVWDWSWLLIGFGNQYILGISHLVIDIWYFVLVITGLKKILGVPYWMGFYLNLLSIVVTFPLTILFMRSPF